MTGIHQLNNNKGVTVATATRPEMVEQVNHDLYTGYIEMALINWLLQCVS